MRQMNNNPAYRLNDGVAYVYNVTNEKSAGLKPLRPLEGSSMMFFEYIGISGEDHSVAMQDEVKLEARIRVLRNARINTKNVIRIGNLYYTVWRVKPGVNKYDVKITDITLITSLDKYEVAT